MEGLFIVGAFLVGVWWVTRPARGAASWAHPWVRAGRELGLGPAAGGVRGTLSGLDVALSVEGERLVVRIDTRGRVPAELEVGPAGAPGQGVATGDPVFDAQVRVAGPPALVAALMTWEARQPLAAAVMELGGTVAEGALVATLPRAETDPRLLASQTRQLVRLARLLRWRPEGLVERLHDNAVEDPKPGVRLANLERLLADHLEHDLTRQALARAAGDPDGRVRAAARRSAGAREARLLQGA